MSDIALLEKAVACHSEGRLHDAAELYKRFLDEVAEHPDALHLRGVALFQLQDAERAEPLIRRAIELRPDVADYHSNLGLVLKELGQPQEAIEAYTTALAIRPDFPDCLNNLASVYAAVGQDSDAEMILTRLLELDPDFAEAANNLGALLLKTDTPEDALPLFERAIENRSGYTDALINLARLHAQLESHAEAAAVYAQLVEAGETDTQLLRDYVDALTRSGQYAEAEEVCRQAIAADPDDAESLVSLGNVQQMNKLVDQAEKSYWAALEKDSSSVRATNNIGTIAMLREEPEVALDWFLKALRIDPDYVEAHFNAGVASQDVGNLDAAAGFFHAALSRRPRLPLAYRNLAEIYRAQGKDEQLRETVETWNQRCPNSATARHFLAACGVADGLDRASDDFVREEFDGFADKFDETLRALQYKTPELIAELMYREGFADKDTESVLDAGCGTGLCGAFLAELGTTVTGVDLSPNMLQGAAKRGHYTELVESELVSFMKSRPSSYDLIVSADTLVYFGALEPVFEAANSALKDGGSIAFSVELHDGQREDGYRLQGNGRFSHTAAYIEECLGANGFSVTATEPATLRMESNEPVTGLLVIAELVSRTTV